KKNNTVASVTTKVKAPNNFEPTEKPIEEVVAPIPEFMKGYLKNYPGEKVFYITSDKQVFLEKDHSLAVLHQASLKNEQKLQTLKIN
ncbi:MAG: hypothetical protein RR256_07040, partial [Bacteroidales bacterium]